MIARDCGKEWQIVFQPDHGDFAGQVASTWVGGPFAEPSNRGSMTYAARRHDDGWAVWERAPQIDADSGKPVNFYELDPAVHISFYQACIDSVTQQDPYAGRLIGVHCAGIYRGRYGVEPELRVTLSEQAADVIDAFVAEQEQITRQAVESGQLDEDVFWRDYKLLQVFDRLALLPCRTDWTSGQEQTFGHVPLADGGEGELRVTILGPNRVQLDAFPLREPLDARLVRRMVPKRAWSSDADFLEDLAATPAETIAVSFTGAPPSPGRA